MKPLPKQSSDQIEESDWNGCYKESWKGVIVDEAFAHPAKFSRGLIRLIYRHASELGWIEPGSVVVDPFGGVALGAFDAMWLGAQWVGCELEFKFVGLGKQNIAAWNQRLDHLKTWGSARLIQGDSRKLSEVLRGAGLAVTSPPFSPDQPCASQTRAKKDYQAFTRGDGTKRDHEMRSEGNLDGLPITEAGLTLALSSPPYLDARQEWQTNSEDSENIRYGKSDGQLSAMKEGDFSLAISSPPYADQQVGTGSSERTGWRGYTDHGGGMASQEAQLASKPATKEGFEIVVSSPPYADGCQGFGSDPHPERARGMRNEKAAKSSNAFRGGYNGSGEHNSGSANEPARGSSLREKDSDCNQPSVAGSRQGTQQPEDFWTAARQIVEETYKVLIPGAHAIWVVKGFVRKGKYVDFPDQWRQLCEAVGFKTLHWHRAWLVEQGNQQHGLDGEITDYSISRKSFFRRLSESKGSPKIDFEVVLCMERQ